MEQGLPFLLLLAIVLMFLFFGGWEWMDELWKWPFYEQHDMTAVLISGYDGMGRDEMGIHSWGHFVCRLPFENS